MSQTECVLALVSGHVQGVYFRACTAKKATELGLSGYAKNLKDGRVEVLAAGPSQQIAALLKWLESGSPNSSVDNIEVEHVDRALTRDGKFTIA